MHIVRCFTNESYSPGRQKSTVRALRVFKISLISRYCSKNLKHKLCLTVATAVKKRCYFAFLYQMKIGVSFRCYTFEIPANWYRWYTGRNRWHFVHQYTRNIYKFLMFPVEINHREKQRLKKNNYSPEFHNFKKQSKQKDGKKLIGGIFTKPELRIQILIGSASV